MLTSAQRELLSFQLKEWEGKSKTLNQKKKKKGSVDRAELQDTLYDCKRNYISLETV